jgi:hypothetical protein
MKALLIVLLLGTMLLVPAAADARENLPYVDMVPEDGATIEAQFGPVGFGFQTPTPDYTMQAYAEVSTQNVPGQDGTLANDYQVDFFSLYQSDANPAIYAGRSTAGSTAWTNVPGTYYWQAQATGYDAAHTYHQWAGPVRRLVVTAKSSPPPPPPPPSNAGPTTDPNAGLCPSVRHNNTSYRHQIKRLRRRLARHPSARQRRKYQRQLRIAKRRLAAGRRWVSAHCS